MVSIAFEFFELSKKRFVARVSGRCDRGQCGRPTSFQSTSWSRPASFLSFSQSFRSHRKWKKHRTRDPYLLFSANATVANVLTTTSSVAITTVIRTGRTLFRHPVSTLNIWTMGSTTVWTSGSDSDDLPRKWSIGVYEIFVTHALLERLPPDSGHCFVDIRTVEFQIGESIIGVLVKCDRADVLYCPRWSFPNIPHPSSLPFYIVDGTIEAKEGRHFMWRNGKRWMIAMHSHRCLRHPFCRLIFSQSFEPILPLAIISRELRSAMNKHRIPGILPDTLSNVVLESNQFGSWRYFTQLHFEHFGCLSKRMLNMI